jgi:hypothetical protein
MDEGPTLLTRLPSFFGICEKVDILGVSYEPEELLRKLITRRVVTTRLTI